MTAALAEPTGLIGYQRPRLEHFPLYHTTLGDDAIDLAAVAGFDLLPWQELIVRESLGQIGAAEGWSYWDEESGFEGDSVAPDWQWASTSVCLITPRQNGKNVCVYARQLAGLYLLGERIIHTAHEFGTADDAYKEMRTRIEAVDDLDDQCIKPHLHGGAEVSIRHKNGGFIRYVARGKNARRGMTRIDLLVLDEAFALDDMMMMSMGPLQQASKRRQLWYTSSAGTADSDVLTRVREAGKAAANPRLMFAEWSCEEGSDPTEFENWKIANPSLGMDGICPVEALEDDFKEKMSLAGFAREHLGMWDDPAMNAIIDLDAWDSCESEDGPEDGAVVACVDVAPDRAFASIAVAQKWSDGRHHVEVIDGRPGTNWVVPQMKRLIASSNPPKCVVLQLGGQAGAFGPELEQIGYTVKYFGTQDIAHATMQFEDDIYGGKLTHVDDPALKSGLAGATKYNIGNAEFVGAWGWLRKSTAVDITGIVAVCYASRGLTLYGVQETLAAKKRYRMA